MCANKPTKLDVNAVKQELADSQAVKACAERHNAVSDISSMRICYLLRHHPDLSVSEIAELVGLSVSATSRCLSKLKAADIVTSSKVAQAVHYRLKPSDFTRQLIVQLGMAS